MNEKELIEEITRIILTNHYNSSAPHVPKKLVPNEKPPWLTNKNKPALIQEAPIQEQQSTKVPKRRSLLSKAEPVWKKLVKECLRVVR